MVKLKIIKSKNKGVYEGEPELRGKEIIFHPVPQKLVSFYRIRPGDIWYGQLGYKKFTGKRDKKGRPIYIQYFIPKIKHTSFFKKSA